MSSHILQLGVGVALTLIACEAFDAQRAAQYAKIAGATYCGQQRKEALEAWNCGLKCIADVTSVKACNGDTAVSIVGKWDETCVVAFEGSQTFGSFLQDLQAFPHSLPWDACDGGDGCLIHGGFWKEWRSQADCVKKNLEVHGCSAGSRKGVRMTGHSLGAGVNLLAMVDLVRSGWNVVESYHFGTPRTGSGAFAALHNLLFEGRSWRVTHARDPVPQLPPRTLGWAHVGPEVYFKGNVSEGWELCTDPGDRTKCAEQHWFVPDDLIHFSDHMNYMDVDLDNGVDHGCAFGVKSPLIPSWSSAEVLAV